VAHATVSLSGGRVTAFRMKVRRAGTPMPDHGGSGRELGRIAAPAAADLLFGLAARGGPAGEELIAAAAIADSAVTWPRLLELARNPKLEGDARRTAVFWLSQAAGEAATRGLDSIIADPTGDRDVREHAVFALSQRPPDEAVPALIRIARGHGDPSIRRKAVFWLGQTDDERAVALFEDLLRR
jgi:HEAT repeat protein